MAERAGDPAYEVRQRINAAMRALRDLEDYARIESPWREGPHHTAVADRTRAIHEQLTDDVKNGKLNRPSAMERLAGLESWAAPKENTHEKETP